MLRLSVLALVLAVGIGPHASMLCGAWCGGDNLPHACDQQLAWSAAAADDCCESGTINLSAARSTESLQVTRLLQPDILSRSRHRHSVLAVDTNRAARTKAVS
jgi:hypothetical protein